MKFGWKKTLIYSLLPMVALLLSLEGAARVVEIWIPPWQADYGWGFDPGSRLFVSSPSDPETLITNPPKEVSFRKQQFRMPKPAGTFRMFMLGGSNVNILFPDLLALADQLTSEFAGRCRFEILDAGGNAYGTHRLTPILTEVLDYEPDAILFYEAHNEFEEVLQSEVAHLETLPLQRILYRSALCRFVRDRMAAYQVSQLQREHNRQILANPFADFKSGAEHQYTEKELAQRMDAFRNNLSIMITKCKARGVPFVIGTVPSNLWKPDLHNITLEQEIKDLYDRGEYEKGLALARERLQTMPRHQSSDAENSIIRDLVRQYGIPMADVESAIIAAEPHGVPGEKLLFDRCHLNYDGFRILLKLFKEQIVAIAERKVGHAAGS